MASPSDAAEELQVGSNAVPLTEHSPSAATNDIEEEVCDEDLDESNPLNVTVIEAGGKCCDGNDSGVDVNGGSSVLGCTGAEFTPAVSCDSSLISGCCSSEDLVSNTLQLSDELRELCLKAGDGTSEGGSESSSIAGYKSHASHCSGRKKCPGVCKSLLGRSRPLTSQATLARSKTPLNRDNSASSRSSSGKVQPTQWKPVKASTPTGIVRTLSTRVTGKEVAETRKLAAAKAIKSRASPMNGTLTDDGRWPSVISKSHSLKRPPVSDKKTNVMSTSTGPVESKASALEKYATLPRRRRKSAENVHVDRPSREPSLNRTTSLRKKEVESKMLSPSQQPFLNNTGLSRTVPPYSRRGRPAKTRIYHEMSVQTALTGDDVQKALAGTPLENIQRRVETKHSAIQVDRRFEKVERLEARLKELEEELGRATVEREELTRVKQDLTVERANVLAQEFRIRGLLPNKVPAGGDLLSELEKHVQLTTDLLGNQQQEISQLQSLCCNMQRELDKSYAAQKNILQQQQEVEAESLEMQEFLLAEKSTLSDSLSDLESELIEKRNLLKLREAEMLKQQEECSHLVRISEQRRQENLSLEARLSGLETWSREVLLHQGAAVSGASVALSGLGTRLDALLDSLVTSYNISEQDLEDVIFHNEAYSQSGSSGEQSSAETSPRHVSQSTPQSGGFVAAILTAIRNATLSRPTPDTSSSEADQLLSSEPEPAILSHRCLMSSSPEKRLSIVSTASCDMSVNVSRCDFDEKRNSIVSITSCAAATAAADSSSPKRSPGRTEKRYSTVSCDFVEGEDAGLLANSESLQNLSQAILRRQEQEEGEDAGGERREGRLEGVDTLVDQVIEVDNLVTKLLKVLRIIQANSETNSIQERNELSSSLHEEKEHRLTFERKAEVLGQEVRELKAKLHATEANSAEAGLLQEKLLEKEAQLNEMGRKFSLTKQLLTENWSQAMVQVRRQYEAIDSALEVLQSLDGAVKHNPALSKLQQDLEEANFRCATTLPLNTGADLNANASPSSLTTINGTA